MKLKRMQFYLDEEMARALARFSRERGTSVSALVRVCIRETLYGGDTLDKAALARTVGGSWKRRSIDAIDREVRRLRRNSRRQRA